MPLIKGVRRPYDDEEERFPGAYPDYEPDPMPVLSKGLSEDPFAPLKALVGKLPTSFEEGLRPSEPPMGMDESLWDSLQMVSDVAMPQTGLIRKVGAPIAIDVAGKNKGMIEDMIAQLQNKVPGSLRGITGVREGDILSRPGLAGHYDEASGVVSLKDVANTDMQDVFRHEGMHSLLKMPDEILRPELTRNLESIEFQPPGGSSFPISVMGDENFDMWAKRADSSQFEEKLRAWKNGVGDDPGAYEDFDLLAKIMPFLFKESMQEGYQYGPKMVTELLRNPLKFHEALASGLSGQRYLGDKWSMTDPDKLPPFWKELMDSMNDIAMRQPDYERLSKLGPGPEGARTTGFDLSSNMQFKDKGPSYPDQPWEDPKDVIAHFMETYGRSDAPIPPTVGGNRLRDNLNEVRPLNENPRGYQQNMVGSDSMNDTTYLKDWERFIAHTPTKDYNKNFPVGSHDVLAVLKWILGQRDHASFPEQVVRDMNHPSVRN